MQSGLSCQAPRASPGEERAPRGKPAHRDSGWVCSPGGAASWGVYGGGPRARCWGLQPFPRSSVSESAWGAVNPNKASRLAVLCGSRSHPAHQGCASLCLPQQSVTSRGASTKPGGGTNGVENGQHDESGLLLPLLSDSGLLHIY